MENRTIVSPPPPEDLPPLVELDDYEPPVTGSDTNVDDKATSAPPFDIGDPPPSVPPPVPVTR